MIRKHENPLAFKAGFLSLLVHVIFLGILIFSFNWKAVQPANIAQVELWDSLPVEKPEPQPRPEPPKPEPKPEPPKPEPKPEPPKPEPVPEPKADIQVKKEPEKKPVEKPKEKPKEKPPEKKVEKKPEPEPDPLAELKKMMLEEQMEVKPRPPSPAPVAPSPAPAESAATQGQVDEYIRRISQKIRGNVNRQLCGSGKPELELEISLMPTGEVVGTPRLLKSSGLSACDDAVVRAVLQSQPLPVPSEPNLFARFRDLRLKFRPNDS